MMEYLQRAVNYVNVFKKTEKVKPPPPPPEEEMTKLDGYLNFACKLVCWEDPTLTWISFICVNLLYSIIIYYETRFYCMVFLMAAGCVALDYYHIDKMQFKHLKRYVNFKDITDSCSTCMYNMHLWKRDNPSFFCGVMMTFFLTLSFIGRAVSGRVLIYLLVLTVYFGPVLFKLAPKEVQSAIRHFIDTIQSNEIVAENELMPVLSQAYDDDDNNDDTRTQDSFTSSLISGIISMPSYLDHELEPRDLEEDDLIPENKTSRFRTGIEYSSDSDSDLPDGMHFETQHFIRESLSSSSSSSSSRTGSDDEHYTKGMHFADVAETLGQQQLSPAAMQGLAQTLGAGMVSSLAAVGSNLLSNLQANFASQANVAAPSDAIPAARRRRRNDSSDNSDFEMIEKDDTIDT